MPFWIIRSFGGYVPFQYSVRVEVVRPGEASRVAAHPALQVPQVLREVGGVDAVKVAGGADGRVEDGGTAVIQQGLARVVTCGIHPTSC